MARILILFISVLILICVSGCAIRPASEENLTGNYSDVGTVTLSVGQPAIGFSLPDANGEIVSLASVLRQQDVLLIFYRGDWCPYCLDQFSTIQPVLPELKSYGVTLLAVSPDEQSAALNTQRRFGQDYRFLSDRSLVITRQYGIDSVKGLPHPAVFLIRKGVSIEQSEVVWMYVSQDHKTRPIGEQLLKQVQRLFKR